MCHYWKLCAGEKILLYTVSSDGIFTVNCELYVLEKKKYGNVVYY